jgi:hypothetical protein
MKNDALVKGQWSIEKANEWYDSNPWIRGFSGYPSNCVNRIAFWQEYNHKEVFEQIENENLQVFADTTTTANLLRIPLSELPGAWDKTEVFDTPPQNL